MSFDSKYNIAHEIIYQFSQYGTLVKATIGTATISIISSTLIAITYLILRYKDSEKANHVSLRCVFLASCMNMIDSVFNLSSMFVYGDTAYCRSSAIIIMFTRAMSSTLLAIVGINLVLVFVINIKSYTAIRLERGYYIGALLYGLITISVPISEEAKSALDPESEVRCFYFIFFYQVLGHGSLLWMWYYGFLFLTTLIAILCSTTASIKLMHEHHSLLNRFRNIASLSETAEASSAHIQIRISNQSSIFKKVVIRCVLYPLVPFISNIWGFIAQLILVSGATPSFTLSMFDNVFSCLQGFFVAIIFFSDPITKEFISKGLQSWKHKGSDNSMNRQRMQREFNRVETTSSTNSDTDVPKTTLQTPSKNGRSTREMRQVTLTKPPRTHSRNSSFNSLDSFLVGKNRRGSSYDETATITALAISPMPGLDVSHPIAISHHHSRNNSGDLNHSSSSPASTYGGSTLAFSERRTSSIYRDNT